MSNKKYHDQYPFMPNSNYIFLGEIPNMPGHCVIGKKDGTQIPFFLEGVERQTSSFEFDIS
jgi:hypothetical protein